MTVGVIGGNGFIGRALITHCEQSGMAVQGYWRQGSTPLFGPMRSARFLDLDAATRLSDPAPIDPALFSDINVLIHAAGLAHVSISNPEKALAQHRRIEVDGLLAVATAARRAGVKRLIYVSSIKAMGEKTRPDSAFKETDPCRPEDIYGHSKRDAEQALQELLTHTDTQWVIIRPPLVYGRGVKAHFRLLASAVAAGWPLPVGRLTENRRSFLALPNLVDLVLCCANHPDAGRRIFLASDDDDISTATLVSRLSAAAKKPHRSWSCPVPLLKGLAYAAGRGGTFEKITESLRVDIVPTRQQLGWTPKVSMHEILPSVFGPLTLNQAQ